MDGYSYDEYYNPRKQHEFAMRVILTGICVIAIAASLFLAITILRFKRLRTRTNMYILHMSIINSIYTLGIIVFLFFNIAYSRALEFAIYIQFYFILLHVIFAFLLALDWFITATKPNWMIYYQKFYKYVFLIIYASFVIELIVTFSISSSSPSAYHHNFKVAIFVAVYFFIIILLLLLNTLKGIVKFQLEALKTKYAFIIANITLFSFIPCLFHHFVYLVSIFYDYTGCFETAFYFITFLPYIVWLSHPILVVYLLGYLNRHFKMAYNKSFRRSTNYSQDDLEELQQEDAETN